MLDSRAQDGDEIDLDFDVPGQASGLNGRTGGGRGLDRIRTRWQDAHIDAVGAVDGHRGVGRCDMPVPGHGVARRRE